jgi:hypothetical protein
LGVDAFLDLEADELDDAGEVDVVLDVIGGEVRDRSTELVRAGATLVTTMGVLTVRPRTDAPSSSLSKPTGVGAPRSALSVTGDCQLTVLG